LHAADLKRRELPPPWPTGEGHEFIELVEFVESNALRKIAIYQQWITDPDGAECTAPWAPKCSKLLLRAESRLRGTLNSGRYVEVKQRPEASKPKLHLVGEGGEVLH
jgi:hypothetical protein